jgi:hypothetical protein
MDPGAGPRTDDRSRSGARAWLESVGRILGQPALRRILPGMLVSALGDGMSMVAVAWLVRGFRGVRLVAVDASLRAVALGAIAALAVAGLLGPALVG